MTQEEVAERLDYIDDIEYLEMKRKVEMYDRIERLNFLGSVLIGILSVAVAIVLIVKVM